MNIKSIVDGDIMAKFCPSCGEKLVDSAKFCKNCGKTLKIFQIQLETLKFL